MSISITIGPLFHRHSNWDTLAYLANTNYYNNILHENKKDQSMAVNHHHITRKLASGRGMGLSCKKLKISLICVWTTHNMVSLYLWSQDNHTKYCLVFKFECDHFLGVVKSQVLAIVSMLLIFI